MDENKSGLYIVGIVAVIAVVALVVLVLGASSKNIAVQNSEDSSGAAMATAGYCGDLRSDCNCPVNQVCRYAGGGDYKCCKTSAAE